jgi:hypothetical protein
MIGKLPLLGFSLATAVSSTALAHENCDRSHDHASPTSYGSPAGYGGPGHGAYGRPPAPPAYVESQRTEVDLRYADLNRDGWVTMQEALDSGRQMFRRNDRDNDRVLTRYELGRPSLRHDDRNNDGRVSMYEYQGAVRARFASLDTNRDGVLARYELGLEPRRATRSAGWWQYR